MNRRARLFTGAAASLLAVSGVLLLGAAPALADGSSGSGSTTSGGSGSGSAGGPAALGGYTLGAIGSGLSIYYEQPNFPVPATPTLEGNLGYTNATFNAGPTGEALASVFWPGQVAANGASQLSL